MVLFQPSFLPKCKLCLGKAKSLAQNRAANGQETWKSAIGCLWNVCSFSLIATTTLRNAELTLGQAMKARQEKWGVCFPWDAHSVGRLRLSTRRSRKLQAKFWWSIALIAIGSQEVRFYSKVLEITFKSKQTWSKRRRQKSSWILNIKYNDFIEFWDL